MENRAGEAGAGRAVRDRRLVYKQHAVNYCPIKRAQSMV